MFDKWNKLLEQENRRNKQNCLPKSFNICICILQYYFIKVLLITKFINISSFITHEAIQFNCSERFFVDATLFTYTEHLTNHKLQNSGNGTIFCC